MKGERREGERRSGRQKMRIPYLLFNLMQSHMLHSVRLTTPLVTTYNERIVYFRQNYVYIM